MIWCRLRSYGLLTVVCASVLLITLSRLPLHGQGQTSPAGKTAEQGFKNIKVLKEIPADQLMPAMQFMAASLGVQCDFCHVEGQFDKDDKKPKQTARKMIQMVMTLNKETFDGHREVTCYTCHHGSSQPLRIPALVSRNVPDGIQLTTGPAKPAADATSTKSAVDTVLEKYLNAAGGEQAILKISSRIQKGTVDMGQRQFPIEIFSKNPEKRASIMHLPNGDSVTAFDGSKGWLGVPGRPVHFMGSGEAEAAAMDADLHFAADLKKTFSGFDSAESEKIDEQPTKVVLATREGKPPVKLYFDEQSGLLLRLVRYADTPLGLYPTQIDYGDYREAAGVKIPYRWTIARPGGQFTVQVQSLEQNVPVDDAKFVAPPPPPPAPESKGPQ
jgi:outer membrane lipoprotein-sorting protein